MQNSAQTLHSLFALPTGDSAERREKAIGAGNKKRRSKKNGGPQRLEPLDGAALLAAKTSFADVRVLILDEMSTISAQFLAFIDSRCQQFMGNSDPFGGLWVVTMGDLAQIRYTSTGLVLGVARFSAGNC